MKKNKDWQVRVIERFTEELEGAGYRTDTGGARVAKRAVLGIMQQELDRYLVDKLKEIKQSVEDGNDWDTVIDEAIIKHEGAR